MAMSPIYFPERDDTDSVSSAPFTCWPVCVSDDAPVQLPLDLVLSGHIATDTPIWLSSINKGVMTFSCALDADNNQDVATCTIALGSVSPVYGITTLSVIGAMVFGTPEAYSNSADYVFEPRTVYLNADSVLPLYTGKVLSLYDVDANRATGRVTLLQGPGAHITRGGDNSVTISFPFTASTTSPFRYLVIQIYNNTLFNIAYDNGNVNLEYAGATLDAVCVSTKATELPGIDGNLPPYPYNQAADDVPATPSPAPAPAGLKFTITIPIDSCGGSITLTSVPMPDTTSRLNINRTADSEVTLSLLG